jgi:Fe-S oxidoreductase
MLTTVERVLFLALAVICLGLAATGFLRVFRAIRRGQGSVSLDRIVFRALWAAVQVLLHRTLLRTRRVLAAFHAFIFFAFSFYFLVNILDLLEGYTGVTTLHRSGVLGVYNLAADVLSVLALAGMVVFLIRRFVVRPRSLSFNPGVMLLPGVTGGIRRDSTIVGGFVLLHVGSRWLGQAFRIAEAGQPDPWQPTASLVAGFLAGFSHDGLIVGAHVSWWLALGLILIFFPYFPRSKHIHLMLAPLNLALQPDRTRMQQAQNGQAGDGAGPGAARLEDLHWGRMLDAYSCIMCNRCQDVCPAHTTGKVLSPAALEINKRYYLNRHLAEFARGASTPPLWEYAISKEAIWACTTCGACVQICPVGNAPMLDIIDLRARLVQEGDVLDPGLQDALVKLGKYGNSFGRPERLRGQWAKALPFAVKDARKDPVDYLWFAGDHASFDPRLQELSRAVARVLHHGGVDFGLLYDGERNSGNDARRAGEEGLFETLAEHNLRQLDRCKFTTILTTDPHSYNAFKHDYPQRGATYPVLHYTELLADLIDRRRLTLPHPLGKRVTYHDPCYLARHNGITEAPRRVLRALGAELVEMPRHGLNTFCCGAGGGRLWMSQEGGTERPSENRMREAVALGVDYFIVSCPKDYAMFTDAVRTTGNEGRIDVRDIIELVENALGTPENPVTPAGVQESRSGS